jgi:hypothetical protein
MDAGEYVVDVARAEASEEEIIDEIDAPQESQNNSGDPE